MTSAPPSLGFRLVLSRDGQAPKVQRVGPTNIAQVGLGRPVADLPKLAGLLFPVCARAHSAAALTACERAAGIDLSKAQSAARTSIVLAESLAACIWRSALTWPALLECSAKPDSVKQARAASDDLVDAIYTEDWKQLGGADLRFDAGAMREALLTFERIVKQLQDMADAVQSQSVRAVSTHCRAMEADRFASNLGLGETPFEETPRSLFAPTRPVRCQSEFFQAQWQHTLRLLDRLRSHLVQIDREPVSSPPAVRDGVGVGVVMTARGRLRHAVELKDGRVESWTALSPTDWNLAPNGLLAQLAANLHQEADPEATAKWAIAAVDPCAPCSVEWVEEAAYA